MRQVLECGSLSALKTTPAVIVGGEGNIIRKHGLSGHFLGLPGP